MIRTYSEFELAAMAVFGPDGSRHWGLAELCGGAPYFFISFCVLDEDGKQRERRVIVPGISALEGFLAGFPAHCSELEVHALQPMDKPSREWKVLKVDKVLSAHEPHNETLTAYILRFSEEPSQVLSAFTTFEHMLIEPTVIYDRSEARAS